MYETISYVTENQKIGVTQQQNKLINSVFFKCYNVTLEQYHNVSHIDRFFLPHNENNCKCLIFVQKEKNAE